MFGSDLGLSVSERDERSKPGIYFLWRDDRIVYIGQAVCMFSRAAEHCQDKHFDRSTFIPFVVSDLDFVESYLIWFLRPEMNKQIPLLGRVSLYARGRVSVRAKAKVIEILESLPREYVESKFNEAETRDCGVAGGNASRRRKRMRLNAGMRHLFSATAATAMDC